MPDREKVIKGIQECDLNGGLIGNCPYKEIVLLLKEQKAQSVLSNRVCEVEPFRYVRKGFCPKCHQEVEWLLNRKYCGFCGQEIRWGGD